MHYRDVKKPVSDRGMRGDIGIVAILRGIAHGDEEGFLGQYLAVGRYRVDLRTELDILRYRSRRIAQKAATFAPREPVGDGGIETQAERAEKRIAVDTAEVR